MTDEAETVVRFLILLEGGVVLGLAAFVLWLRGMGGAATLPPYAWAISVSYMLMVITTMMRHLLQGLWVMWPVILVAYSLGLMALYGALRFEQARIHRMLKSEKTLE